MSILASSLALATADDTWRDHALCRDTDPDLFFPVGTTGHALVAIDHAKRVCQEWNAGRQRHRLLVDLWWQPADHTLVEVR